MHPLVCTLCSVGLKSFKSSTHDNYLFLSCIAYTFLTGSCIMAHDGWELDTPILVGYNVTYSGHVPLYWRLARQLSYIIDTLQNRDTYCFMVFYHSKMILMWINPFDLS
jgi:hypothetical protein